MRVTDVRILEERVRQPDMDGLVAGDFNAEEWLADPDNIAVTDGLNMMLFTRENDDRYQGHWLLTERGSGAFLVAVHLLRIIFRDYGARTVYGLVPAHCRASAWFTRQMGFTSEGKKNTADGEQEYFSMTRKEFEARYGLFES